MWVCAAAGGGLDPCGAAAVGPGRVTGASGPECPATGSPEWPGGGRPGAFRRWATRLVGDGFPGGRRGGRVLDPEVAEHLVLLEADPAAM